MNDIVVIDNYDSFVYNLVQYLGEIGVTATVFRNDEVSLAEIAALKPRGILLSPGPGHPREAGICVAAVEWAAQTATPLLGVCLGHQAIGEYFGATVEGAGELLHGESSFITHDGTSVFANVPSPVVVGRYHSLAITEVTLPDDLMVSARAGDVVMGVRHRSLPIEGVQFHPESVLTSHGYTMLANWLEKCGITGAVARVAHLNARMDAVRAGLPAPLL